MHIAFLNWDSPVLPYRGAGQVNHYLLRGLLQAGHKVTFVIVDLPYGPKIDEAAEAREYARLGDLTRNLTVRRFHYFPPKWMRWRPGLLWQGVKLRTFLRQLHAEVGFDLLELPDGMCQMPWRTSWKFPRVVRIHGGSRLFDSLQGKTTDTFLYWMEKRNLEVADFVVGVSRFSVEASLQVHGIATLRRPPEVIYNALDPDLYAPAADPEAAAEDGHIVFINAIENRKGARELCLAMERVVAQYPAARLSLIGGISGKARLTEKDIDQLLEGLPPAVRARISLPGWVFDHAEKLAWLRRAAVCAYPSKTETFGIAPLEAMAMQRPVVYTRETAGPEVIDDGVHGLLANPHDPADIAEKILYLLQNPVEARQMAAAGRRRAVDKFAMGPWIEENIAFYERCLREF